MFWLLFDVALFSIAIWAVLFLVRGGFWRADQMLDSETLDAFKPKNPGRWPSVVAIVPARNEADTIAEIVRAHARTDYPGDYGLIVVDDHSTDGTGELARAAGAETAPPVHVVSPPDLEPGWSGKLFALKAGLEAQPALLPQCDYILLTDADILHPPENARRLVAQAESTQSALVSLMALLDCRGFWGRLLIPPFVFFFQKLYPFRWVNDPEEAHAGAAGGCVLVRRNVLRSIGDMEGIRDALIDDCALAAAVKGNPPKRRIWLGLSQDVKSLRDNRAFGSIWTMVARTAFTQLRHSTGMLFLSIVGMILTYLAGPVVFVAGLSAGSVALIAIGITAWSLSALAYLPTLRLFGQNPLWAFTLPLAALLYSAMTVGSAVNHWRGHGGAWKGRSYSDLTKPSDASAPPKPS